MMAHHMLRKDSMDIRYATARDGIGREGEGARPSGFRGCRRARAGASVDVAAGVRRCSCAGQPVRMTAVESC